jgi:hypothetical protein
MNIDLYNIRRFLVANHVLVPMLNLNGDVPDFKVLMYVMANLMQKLVVSSEVKEISPSVM